MASTARGHALLLDGEPIVATEEERQALADLERLLLSDGSARLKLLASGQQVEVPETAARLFRRVAQHLADGNAIVVSPLRPQVPVSQAADLLNVRYADVLELLDQGELAYVEAHGIRLIPLTYPLAYRKRRDVQT